MSIKLNKSRAHGSVYMVLIESRKKKQELYTCSVKNSMEVTHKKVFFLGYKITRKKEKHENTDHSFFDVISCAYLKRFFFSCYF